MPITVYHFCCERDMRGIRSKGITKGVIVGEQLINPGALKEKWNKYIIEGWQRILDRISRKHFKVPAEEAGALE